MLLLLDENIARCVARGGTTYTAQRSLETPGLGRGAADEDVYAFVRRHGAVLVTQDRDDFARIVVRRGAIPVIVLPSVAPRTQHAMLLRAIPIAERVFAADPASFVEVLPDGRVQSYRVRPGNNRRKPP
jgi:predicted nuclease of predicted toxin-antitoxin system